MSGLSRECNVEVELNPVELVELFGGLVPPSGALVCFEVREHGRDNYRTPVIRLTLANLEQQPWSKPPAVETLSREQKALAFETAMAVARDRFLANVHSADCGAGEVAAAARGVVEAAIAAAEKLTYRAPVTPAAA